LPAARAHQADHADLAVGDHVGEAEGQVVADALGDQQRLGVLDADEPWLVTLGRDLERPVGRDRADEGERTALEELDRLLVERVEDLGPGCRPRLGNDTAQVVERFQLGHRNAS
jgi:hypothetical protein